MRDDADSWQTIFLLSGALFVAFQMFRGWRLGVVRQLVNLLALIVCYGVAIFGGRLAVPVLRPLGYPDFIVSLLAGALMALVVFLAISALGRLLFRRTDQQSLGLVRLGYGVGGSAIGMVFGFLTVWLVVLGIRLLGTVAQTEIEAARPAPHRPPTLAPPNQLALRIAGLKKSIEQGASGQIVQALDPIPEKFYDIMSKIGRVMASSEAADRFFRYPGALTLSQHPRILALQRDPGITREIQQRNFLGLLKSQQLKQVLDDPEVTQLVKNFELEKALDYALQK